MELHELLAFELDLNNDLNNDLEEKLREHKEPLNLIELQQEKEQSQTQVEQKATEEFDVIAFWCLVMLTHLMMMMNYQGSIKNK